MIPKTKSLKSQKNQPFVLDGAKVPLLVKQYFYFIT
jgi:hypothetical protein